MPEDDIYIAGIGQAVLELLSLISGQEITKEESACFKNVRKSLVTSASLHLK